MRARILFLIAIAVLSGSRCSLPWEERGVQDLSIVSYNAHNLFDDIEDGGEYPEFRLDSGKWNSELYEKRLANTAAALCSFFPEGRGFPDIICLQEVESEKVLTDLANGPLRKGGYRWAALGGPSTSAVKCGILSRYSPSALRAHSHADAWGFGPGRDILEATFDLGADGERLTLFVCHWKSRREGEAATEVARRSASGLVAARITEITTADPGRCIIVCGDFNESPDEFSRVGYRYPTAIMPDPQDLPHDQAAKEGGVPRAWFDGVLRTSGRSQAVFSQGEGVTLYSPWFGVEGFSYIFDGKEERLDGFLLGSALMDGQGLEFSRFLVSSDPSLFDGKGEPLPWGGSSGFSDHLPIALILSGGSVR